MDFLSSKRFITTSLLLLVLLNITLVGVLWWQNFVTTSYRSVEITRMYSSGDPGKNNLLLTEKQKNAFMKLRQEHFRKTRPTLKKIIALKKELIAESIKPEPDKARLSAIADSIGKHQVWLENDLATHFHQLSLICTPEQRDPLEAMLNKIYTVRYQKISSWRERPDKDHREDRHEHEPPPPNP